MSKTTEQLIFYVAPPEPPPSRRPPLGTVGFIGWLRKNLFSSLGNSLLTVISFVFIIWLLNAIFSWVFFTADWSVVNNNILTFMVGRYDVDELWRVEVLSAILLILSVFGVVFWGQVTRAFFVATIFVTLFIVLLPIGGSELPEPPIRLLVSAQTKEEPFFFVGDAGQEITIAIEPITANANIEVTSEDFPYVGYIEARPGLESSRNTWNSVKAQVRAGTLDLANYNLSFRVEIIDKDGRVIERFDSLPPNPDVALTYTLPETGWYAVRIAQVQNFDGISIPSTASVDEAGYAWVRLDNIQIYYTGRGATAERTEKYGEQPNYPCPPQIDCIREAAEKELRFEGKRTFNQYIKTQLTPFLKTITRVYLVALGIIAAAMLVAISIKRSKSKQAIKLATRITLLGWILLIPFSYYFLLGWEDSDILPYVRSLDWGGLLLTLVLTFISVVVSFPIGIALALGRRSQLRIMSLASTVFIEVVRGVPLITILFMANTIVPFVEKSLSDVERVVPLLVGLTLFSAAYQAEIVRGGFQILPKGQIEAARALGLSPMHTTLFIILPQALRAVIPAIMSQYVSLFKDTSLVSVVGMQELVGIIDHINGEARYGNALREEYLFVGLIYFVVSYIMSAVSKRLEESGSGAARRR